MTAITIERCIASQLVGSETFKIAEGTLSLEQIPEGNDALGAPLLLKITDSTFALPIERNATVGTRGDRSYLFSKKLSPVPNSSIPESVSSKIEGDLKDVSLESDGYQKEKDNEAETTLLVQIDMPATASEASLTRFEKCLVDHGFLMVGAQADADNLSRAFLEWTGLKSKSLMSYTNQSTSGQATTSPTQFSETTHSMTSNAATGSTTFSEATSKVGETINAGMTSIGSFLGSKIGSKGLFSTGSADTEPGMKKDIKEAVEDGAESVAIVGAGVVEGTKHAAGVASEASSQTVEHNYGTDAVKVKEAVGTTMQNVGSVGVTALEQSSMMMHGVQVGKGAVTEDEAKTA